MTCKCPIGGVGRRTVQVTYIIYYLYLIYILSIINNREVVRGLTAGLMNWTHWVCANANYPTVLFTAILVCLGVGGVWDKEG